LYLDYFSTGLIAVFSLLVLVLGGYRVCYQAFSMGSKMPGIEELNRGWFYLVLILTGALNLLYCIDHFRHPRPGGETGLPDAGKEKA
jgi:TRAP-type C4-dicarboxylate transport system permease small subunit